MNYTQRPKVSVIVPVYNAARYIERCVNSLLAQSFTDFELVIIDDGSLDDSVAICRRLSASDPRVQLIVTTNAGASAARNRGIDESRGQYIVFCDADDFAGREYLADFFTIKHDKTALVIQYPSHFYENSDTAVPPTMTPRTGIYDIGSGLHLGRLLHNGYPFGKLYDAKIIRENGLRFNPAISYKEDLIFMLEYLRHVETIAIAAGTEYRYCVHAQSLSTRWKNPCELIKINITVSRLLQAWNIDHNYYREFETFCVGETLHMIYNAPATTKIPRRVLLRELKDSLHTDAFLIQTRFDGLLGRLFHKRMFHTFDLLRRIVYTVMKKIYK